jgi:PAS domain S-box-containing protein
MLETGKASIEGKKLLQFVAPDHRDIFYGFFEHLLRSGGQHNGQFKFISGAGREFYVRAEGCAIRSASQCYIAIMDMTEDIRTHLRMTEIQSQIFTHTIFQDMEVSFSLTVRQGIIMCRE